MRYSSTGTDQWNIFVCYVENTIFPCWFRPGWSLKGDTEEEEGERWSCGTTGFSLSCLFSSSFPPSFIYLPPCKNTHPQPPSITSLISGCLPNRVFFSQCLSHSPSLSFSLSPSLSVPLPTLLDNELRPPVHLWLCVYGRHSNHLVNIVTLIITQYK